MRSENTLKFFWLNMYDIAHYVSIKIIKKNKHHRNQSMYILHV